MVGIDMSSLVESTCTVMPFRLIFFSFAKCENKGEVAGHENMTLTRRMAHARIELHKKLSFDDIHPMTVV